MRRQLFNLTIPRAEVECGDVSPLINGVSVGSGSWKDNHGGGHGVLLTKLVNGLGERKIYASWETLCIPDQAQLLSFTVHNIGQDTVQEPSGFTASFKQQGQPEILRLAGEPTDLEPKDVARLDSWVTPVASHRLSILAPEPGRDSHWILKDQFRQLAVLEAEAHELAAAIHQKKNHIKHIIQQDFRSTIDACPGIKCVLQTTFRQVPKIFHLIADRFCHGRQSSFKIYQSAANESRSLDKDIAGSNVDLFNVPHPPSSSLDADKPDWQLPTNDGLPPPPMTPPPPDDDMPGPPRDDMPPPQPPEMGPPTPGRPGKSLPPPDHGRHKHHPPPPLHRHHHHRRHGPRILKRIILLIIFVSLASLAFRHVRHHTTLFRSCTRTADRACRREERRNRRDHRRAALHHNWSTWWNRYRRPRNSADYDEKRTLILEQEAILEDAMQDELRALRSAHAIVEEMYDAEEGRSRLYRAANRPGASVAELDAAGSSRRGRSGSAGAMSLDSLPPPPRYEEELEGDLTVVDGFQYTPSSSSVDNTPDSSVIDCSPRVSSDTVRTVVTRGDGKD